MPKIETLTRNGKQERCVNIDAPVGPWEAKRTKNLLGDVLLIQAAFHILVRVMNPRYIIGSYDTDQAPAPTGQYDLKTENAIQLFQKTRRSELLKADGVIDHASHKDRNVVGSRFMTITLLHTELRDCLGGYEPDTYPEEIIRRVPQLAGLLK